jgi:hypothetical protein
MGPQFNKLMDSGAFSVALMIAGFVLWLGAAVSLLALA